jgi:protein ImuB
MGSRSLEVVPTSERRIVALVLPELLVELVTEGEVSRAGETEGRPGARRKGTAREQRGRGEAGREGASLVRGIAKPRPLGVVLVSSDAEVNAEPALPSSMTLAAVNAEARRCGVHEGQTVAEAGALVAGFVVKRVSLARVERALESVAEAALSFGATVAIGAPDTVWVDVTGSAHLFGGELALATELVGRIRSMGHAVRLAVAGGPTLARMFARYLGPARVDQGEPGVFIVPKTKTLSMLSSLPVIALPLGDELRDWLVRLGVLTISDLLALPRESLGPRLGAEAAHVLEIAAGRDRAPLKAFQPARSIVEAVSWEHDVAGTEPLLFALRGLVARLSARLEGRGEAAQSLVLTIEHAPAFVRFRGTEPFTVLRFALAFPLYREDQLCRIISSRLERVKLPAPSIGLKLEAPVLTEAVQRQLEFSEFLSGTTGAEEELPLIVAELVADIGEDRVGVLEVVDSHRPEAQSRLVPVASAPEKSRSSPRKSGPRRAVPERAPTPLRKAHPRRSKGAPVRLLPEPIQLFSPWHVGAALAIGSRLYTVERIVFDHRLEGVEWWSRAPVARDYVRLWLKSAEGVSEALAFIERDTQRAFLQAIAD